MNQTHGALLLHIMAAFAELAEIRERKIKIRPPGPRQSPGGRSSVTGGTNA
jgi:hypothetical protein